jgi:hypothetical protein
MILLETIERYGIRWIVQTNISQKYEYKEEGEEL